MRLKERGVSCFCWLWLNAANANAAEEEEEAETGMNSGEEILLLLN